MATDSYKCGHCAVRARFPADQVQSQLAAVLAEPETETETQTQTETETESPL